MKTLRIAILGATSHIAKGLIDCWTHKKDRELLLYARDLARVREFLDQLGRATEAKVYSIEEYGSAQHDVVVNCVGIGNPQKLVDNIGKIFSVTVKFDDLILDYLSDNPQAAYINLSSGAAYGADFLRPVDEKSRAIFNINDLKPDEFYGIAKLHSEARHRALKHLNIIDLRIFGYLSRYIDLNEKFLMSEIISCLKNKQTFTTSPIDIWRDYLHPQDLASFIDCCINYCPLNAGFDAYSKQAVSKFELLSFFAKKYGLEYKVDNTFQPQTATGTKQHYYSINHAAECIGYKPLYSSIEGVTLGVSSILE